MVTSQVIDQYSLAKQGFKNIIFSSVYYEKFHMSNAKVEKTGDKDIRQVF